jgi:putative oxidoreductase
MLSCCFRGTYYIPITMNIALWVVQALLALAFLMAGGMKLAMPIDQLLANGMTLVEQVPIALIRFIGLSEVAGALGLILPATLRIKPQLTPWAAGALAFVMLLAVVTHVWLGEMQAIGAALMLGLLAAFVAWGRSIKQPITTRELEPAASS